MTMDDRGASARASGGRCFSVPGRGIPGSLRRRQEPLMGLKDDVTGKAKEAEGKLTGDKSREAEGKLDQAKGKAEDALDDVKDAAGKQGGLTSGARSTASPVEGAGLAA